MSFVKSILLESLRENRKKILKENLNVYDVGIGVNRNMMLIPKKYSLKKNRLDIKKKGKLIRDFLNQNPDPTSEQIISLMKTMPDYKIYNDLLSYEVDPENDRIYKKMLRDYEKDFLDIFFSIQKNKNDSSLQMLKPLEILANTISYLYLDTIVDVIGMKDFNFQRFYDIIVDIPLDGIKVKINGEKVDISDIIDDNDFINIYKILIRKGHIVASVDKRDKEIRKFRTLLQKFMNTYKEAVKRGEQKKDFDYNTTPFQKILEWFEKKYGFTTEFPNTLEKYYERNKSKFN
jgi:hypothetical protein